MAASSIGARSPPSKSSFIPQNQVNSPLSKGGSPSSEDSKDSQNTAGSSASGSKKNSDSAILGNGYPKFNPDSAITPILESISQLRGDTYFVSSGLSPPAWEFIVSTFSLPVQYLSSKIPSSILRSFKTAKNLFGPLTSSVAGALRGFVVTAALAARTSGVLTPAEVRFTTIMEKNKLSTGPEEPSVAGTLLAIVVFRPRRPCTSGGRPSPGAWDN